MQSALTNMNPTEQEKLAVIDAALEVLAFVKTHEYPTCPSTSFFKYQALLNNLEVKVSRAYPQFIPNLRKDI